MLKHTGGRYTGHPVCFLERNKKYNLLKLLKSLIIVKNAKKEFILILIIVKNIINS